ncbi:MAG: lipoprotein releasing system, ATP-binding protein [Verrucomicrobiales bacterium]|nr:lipoprotein releasing system, ATP-binding protein [Verrucomicrobiales bacterium]
MNNATAKPLLEARAVHKTYKMGRNELHVLRGIDLVVNAGEFLALRGSSGAGKSTLLHLLGGLDLPNEGEVLFDGKNLRSLSGSNLAELRNRRASFIFQAYHLLPELNAIENVCLPGRIARRNIDEVMSRAEELLARVGLAKRTTHRPYELSGGERQRVAIARSLINSPDLVLADEPTGNLDSHTGEEIIDLLCALRDERKMTLLIATHDSKIAARAPRVIQLVDGKITNSP